MNDRDDDTRTHQGQTADHDPRVTPRDETASAGRSVPSAQTSIRGSSRGVLTIRLREARSRLVAIESDYLVELERARGHEAEVAEFQPRSRRSRRTSGTRRGA
jgi:hypothetical protein